ncbi:Mbov_0400 family ICE element protein [Mesomycoplasma hyopneumoniae]|uniref:Mbov_0400 family ICE element protein n=1 Tax=Mesomycoplasma hyopneumoniae TaxID=2099 RepID=UPI003857A9CF
MAIKDWIKLKKFSPFKTLVFNSLAQKIKERPVIIFHDTEENYYYYIKARDARLDDGRLKNPFQGEILIPKSDKPNTLFTKDSYLDCSQIFYIRDSELEELVKNNPKTEILDSKELEFDQVEKMFNNIYECLTSKPPYIVISKVSYDSKTKQTKPEVQYASDQHINNDYKTIRFKTKKIKELKNKLHEKKNQISLDLFEGVLNETWTEYRQKKVYNPLFKWIKENKFIQKGLNSIEIIHEYNRLSKPLVPATIDGQIIHTCLVNNRWHDRWDFSLSKKLEATDYKFMIDWFEKNELNINMQAFNQFCNAMKKEWPQSHVFDFDELEFQLKQEISKLEKQKQIQNQKTIKDKFIYQNARLQAEKWVQEEEERLKKYVPKFKMKM